MIFRFSAISTTLFALFLLLVDTAVAETPEEKGYRIAQEAASRDEGYGDYRASGRMILRNPAGHESVRDFDFQRLEQTDGDLSLLVFNHPGDIRDTALLTHARVEGNDLQWLYLPAIRRVKRITSAGRSGSFVGSEFAYEDMVDQEVEKFDFRWLDNEPCADASNCQVIERFPRFTSAYRRQIIWLDEPELRVRKIEYHNRRDELEKTLQIDDYEQYEGRFWRASLMRMENHVTGKSTDLRWSDFRFSQGLSATDFSTRALERLR